MTRFAAIFGILLATTAAACGTGGAASSIRPTDPTATATIDGGECHETSGDAEPLIVDWRPEDRGDLEIAMKDGLAVVSYSCKSMKLLKDCHIDGAYGFIGVTTKEQTIQLTNADEVKANLPLGGIGIVGSVGGELQRGTTIDIGMMIIGKRRTTWAGAAAADLKGSCDGATHFVRGSTVGAFAMGTGTSAKVRAAAEIFGASASGASTSSKDVHNRDGDLSACAKATPDAEKPPAQCGAPIRLVLTPIVASKSAVVASPRDNSCPKDLVWADGKCTAPARAATHLCKPGDIPDCTAQCDKGNFGSCNELGVAFVGSGHVDLPRAAGLFKKACDGGHARGCVNYANMMQAGAGGIPADPQKAVQIQTKACDEGEATGCASLGDSYMSGKGATADHARAAALFTRTCDGGLGYGCYMMGQAFAKGDTVPKDPARAASYYKRGCDAGNMPDSCKAATSGTGSSTTGGATGATAASPGTPPPTTKAMVLTGKWKGTVSEHGKKYDVTVTFTGEDAATVAYGEPFGCSGEWAKTQRTDGDAGFSEKSRNKGKRSVRPRVRFA